MGKGKSQWYGGAGRHHQSESQSHETTPGIYWKQVTTNIVFIKKLIILITIVIS